jgi:hypothetical protein
MRSSQPVLAFLVMLGGTIACNARGYTFETFSVPASHGRLSKTQPAAINNHGPIVGEFYYAFRDVSGFIRHANGAFEYPIRYSGEVNSLVGINNLGVVIGNASIHDPITDRTVPRPFFYYQGQFTDFHPPGGDWSVLAGINYVGDVVGSLYDQSSPYETHNTMLSNGVIEDVSVPGLSGRASHPYAIAWDRTVVGVVSLAQFSAGYVRGPDGNFFAFTWPGAISIQPRAINNAAGKIAGTWLDANEIINGNYRSRGFVYDYLSDLFGRPSGPAQEPSQGGAGSTTYPIPVRTVPIVVIDPPGSVYTNVTGINSHGVITGYCSVGGRLLGFIGTPTP